MTLFSEDTFRRTEKTTHPRIPSPTKIFAAFTAGSRARSTCRPRFRYCQTSPEASWGRFCESALALFYGQSLVVVEYNGFSGLYVKCHSIEEFSAGADPTTVNNNAMNSIERFKNKSNLFYFEKRPSLLCTMLAL
jgi:hypothetical protein